LTPGNSLPTSASRPAVAARSALGPVSILEASFEVRIARSCIASRSMPGTAPPEYASLASTMRCSVCRPSRVIAWWMSVIIRPDEK
jgi:hypothetical protein